MSKGLPRDLEAELCVGNGVCSYVRDLSSYASCSQWRALFRDLEYRLNKLTVVAYHMLKSCQDILTCWSEDEQRHVYDGLTMCIDGY